VTTVIKIHPSPTADTRTCDWSKVTRETLLASSKQHIRDVREGLAFFADRLARAGMRHDHDKILAIDHFHADFRTGFAQTGWWDNHRKVNRHHLTETDGIPADVNLIDVLDFITDCVMAGMARSGSVRPLTIEPAVLQRAFENTAALLCANVEVAAAEEVRAPLPDGRDATREATLDTLDKRICAFGRRIGLGETGTLELRGFPSHTWMVPARWEVRWRRDYAGVPSDERMAAAESLPEALAMAEAWEDNNDAAAPRATDDNGSNLVSR
jgi:hypothetical protein